MLTSESRVGVADATFCSAQVARVANSRRSRRRDPTRPQEIRMAARETRVGAADAVRRDREKGYRKSHVVGLHAYRRASDATCERTTSYG